MCKKMRKDEVAEIVAAARVFESYGLMYGVIGWTFESPDDFGLYLQDPDMYEAEYEGVSVESLLRSRNQDMLLCSHTLKSGRTCRNHVQGMHYGSSPQDYERLAGGYCWKHGG